MRWNMKWNVERGTHLLHNRETSCHLIMNKFRVVPCHYDVKQLWSLSVAICEGKILISRSYVTVWQISCNFKATFKYYLGMPLLLYDQLNRDFWFSIKLFFNEHFLLVH